jgi:hypothetical protein
LSWTAPWDSGEERFAEFGVKQQKANHGFKCISDLARQVGVSRRQLPLQHLDAEAHCNACRDCGERSADAWADRNVTGAKENAK